MTQTLDQRLRRRAARPRNNQRRQRPGAGAVHVGARRAGRFHTDWRARLRLDGDDSRGLLHRAADGCCDFRVVPRPRGIRSAQDSGAAARTQAHAELAKGLRQSGREKVATRTAHSPFRPHSSRCCGSGRCAPAWSCSCWAAFTWCCSASIYSRRCTATSPASNRQTSMARVGAGLWLPYAMLLLCVEFHASVGLYRLAIKWGADLWMSRETMHRIEQVIFWVDSGDRWALR